MGDDEVMFRLFFHGKCHCFHTTCTSTKIRGEPVKRHEDEHRAIECMGAPNTALLNHMLEIDSMKLGEYLICQNTTFV